VQPQPIPQFSGQLARDEVNSFRAAARPIVRSVRPSKLIDYGDNGTISDLGISWQIMSHFCAMLFGCLNCKVNYIEGCVMNALVKIEDQPTEAAENATNKLLSILDEKSQTAKAELERLIGELQQLRQTMDDEGKHVQQEIAEFTSLSQSTLEFAKLVRDGTSNVKPPPSPEVRGEGAHDD
jgi:hypothetical protein